MEQVDGVEDHPKNFRKIHQNDDDNYFLHQSVSLKPVVFILMSQKRDYSDV
jgi:hypothetical protein